MQIPSQYLPIMPYLILNDAVRFADFAKTVFGATEQMIVPGDDKRSIMHGELKIHDAVIMFASAGDLWQEKSSGMFIYVDSVDKVYDLALRNNARSLQLPATQEYGYAAGFEDPFGNQWWITEPQTT
ncbi:MAG TPA: VOC family protein [Flavobacterium sp.]|nr:VOC family protein [Flavobacterium sp.]